MFIEVLGVWRVCLVLVHQRSNTLIDFQLHNTAGGPGLALLLECHHRCEDYYQSNDSWTHDWSDDTLEQIAKERKPTQGTKEHSSQCHNAEAMSAGMHPRAGYFVS